MAGGSTITNIKKKKKKKGEGQGDAGLTRDRFAEETLKSRGVKLRIKSRKRPKKPKRTDRESSR